MMVGEINYQDNFLKPFLQGDLPFPLLALAVFIWFVLLVPILLMNLLIELHTNLEEQLPYWFMKQVDQVTVKEFPNRWFSGKIRWFFGGNEVKRSRTRLSLTIHQLTPLERKLTKQKYRLKEMSETTEKHHNLLKLIVQKMEISSEDMTDPSSLSGTEREAPHQEQMGSTAQGSDRQKEGSLQIHENGMNKPLF